MLSVKPSKKFKKTLNKPNSWCYNKEKRKREVTIMTNTKMTKREFIKRFKEDYGFRHEMRCKGVRVIADNVIFFNQDGNVRKVAGADIK